MAIAIVGRKNGIITRYKKRNVKFFFFFMVFLFLYGFSFSLCSDADFFLVFAQVIVDLRKIILMRS